MEGDIFWRTYKLDPLAKDASGHWIADEMGSAHCKYLYDENLEPRDNAYILAGRIVDVLTHQSPLKSEAYPRPIPIWADHYFGVEVFYCDQSGTKKISVRVR